MWKYAKLTTIGGVLLGHADSITSLTLRGVQRRIGSLQEGLLAAGDKGSVLRVRVRAVVDPPGGLKSFPIDGRRLKLVLVSVAALERAAGKRIERGRERRSRCEWRHQNAAREEAREHDDSHTRGASQESRLPGARWQEIQSS